jgi:cardiolipin synthase
MYAPSLSSRQGIISLASAFLLALCLALTGCDINISTNGFPSAPSSSTGSQCQANCVTGTGVNGVSVFVEPNAGESPIVDAIDGAKKSVWLEMYILSDTNVIRALEETANRGIDVRVMLEPHPVGTSSPTSTMDKLRAAGAKVEETNPAFALTHEKGMIIDGTTAYIMTSNFSRSALGGYGSSSRYSENREYDIIDTRFQDVQAVTAIFNADWSRSNAQFNDPNLVVSPVNARNDFMAFINSAHHTLIVEAEEMQDSSIEQALVSAAQRGVQVEVILPSSGTGNDQGIQTIKQGGVQVKEDSQLYMHAKMMVADGREAFVGSENISSESLDHNRELGILISDSGVISTLEQTFQQDWGVSHSV